MHEYETIEKEYTAVWGKKFEDHLASKAKNPVVGYNWD
jgi:hypothetical protein